MSTEPVTSLATIDYLVMALYFVAVLGVGWGLRDAGALRRSLLGALVVLCLGCGDKSEDGIQVTLPVSVLGGEARVLRTQLARFAKEHPEIRVVQRETPDAADQRHQLYVQWLNAGASDPDILQLDAIWTPEFAAAGWILPLEQFAPDTAAFFPAAIAANRWRDTLYALPWFLDVGMLYWRTDLMDSPPATFDQLRAIGTAARESGRVRATGSSGRAPGTRGLVTTFLEYLGGHGGTHHGGRTSRRGVPGRACER